MARRDNLREQEMSVVEGLVWRYPTKALLELTTTCPLYCGHCTRLDLVGPDVPGLTKRRWTLRPAERLDAIASFIESTPSIRDIVLSGGDIANVGHDALETIVTRLLAIPHVRTLRLATKGLATLPQHFLRDDTRRLFDRLAARARTARVELAVHTHINHAASVTPLVADAVAALYESGVRAVRNQAVLMRGVNDSAQAILDLSFALLDHAQITPYYLFLFDLIPGGEHWRTTLRTALDIQEQIVGYLPGFATPRVTCDVPHVGKRPVHQVKRYDEVRGISCWTKNYWTTVEGEEGDPKQMEYEYFDPVSLLPNEGQRYWSSEGKIDGRRRVRVGFSYNEKRIRPDIFGQNDAEAEFDSPDVLAAIRSALAAEGYDVVNLEATADLPRVLLTNSVDVIFNMAEGRGSGRGRESQAPALFELLGIPHSGSDAATLAYALDKSVAKQIVGAAGVPTPRGVVLRTGDDRVERDALSFPAIVKPLTEGSSKGILGTSVVHDRDTLMVVADAMRKKYGGPVIVEEFLSGREFTVGLLGYPDPVVLPVMEVEFLDSENRTPIYSFEAKQHDTGKMRYPVPAALTGAEHSEIVRLARTAFHALGCRDLARLDFRMDGEGRLHFIECNPLPGLTPRWSDFVVMAAAGGVDYQALIRQVVAGALARRHA
jgi:lysine 2,3-aminomutase